MKKHYASALMALAMAVPAFAAPIDANKAVQIDVRTAANDRLEHRIDVIDDVVFTSHEPGEWGKQEESFAIGGWFKLDQFVNEAGDIEGAAIMQHHAREHSNFNGSFLLKVDKNGQLQTLCAGACDQYSSWLGSDNGNTGYYLTPGQWANIVLSYNSEDSVATIYHNGTAVVERKIASGHFMLLPDNPTRIQFGANGFQGQIDELYFYKAALTPATVAAAMRDPRSVEGLSCYYDLNEANEDFTFSDVTGTTDLTAAYVEAAGAGASDGVTGAKVTVMEPNLVDCLRDADAGYQHVTGYNNHGGRAIGALRISTSTGYTDITGLQEVGARSPIFFDRTAADSCIVLAKPGDHITVASIPDVCYGEWMHAYTYLDKDNDGAFNAAWDFENHKAAGDLVGATAYNEGNDGGNYYDAKGDVSDAHQMFNAFNMGFDLPADVTEGTFRVRFKVDWNNIDPYGQTASNNHICNNGGVIVDFTIKLGVPDTINVVADPVEAGKVYIDNEGAEQAYVGNGGKAKLYAVANDDYEFVNWTLDGVEVSTSPIYEIVANGNATYTAHFQQLAARYYVNYSGEGVAVKVTKDGLDLPNGSRVFVDSEIVVTLEPEDGYKTTSLTVNGKEMLSSYNAEGELRLTVTEDLEIKAVAEVYTPHLALKVSGEGEARLWYYEDDDDTTPEIAVADGDELPVGLTLYGYFKSNEAVDLSINGMDLAALLDEGSLEEGDEGEYFLYFVVPADDVEVRVGFGVSAVNTVAAQASEARYFNLQGIEVNAENLSDGIYIVRTAEGAKKVYIRK